MGLARTMVTALFLSGWLMMHAVFLANVPSAEQARAQRLLPLRIPSVFHLPWFRTLVKTHMDMDMLKISASDLKQQPSTSFWTTLFNPKRGGSSGGATAASSSSRSFFTILGKGKTDAKDELDTKPGLRLLCWVITAMTMAEWITVVYLAWTCLWQTILRPVILILTFLAILLIAFYCVKTYFFFLHPAISDDAAPPAILSYITSADNLVHGLYYYLWSYLNSGLHLLDRLLAVLVTPAAVLEEEQLRQKQGLLQSQRLGGLEAGIAGVVHSIQQTLYAVLSAGQQVHPNLNNRSDL
ncbi:transmembrane [Cystoisospora suis]|uniref:Transmembrane n=1 Tax=Cystoisospora suis TaxID=483139 RepID=A0A2C6JKF4_9APIC|nr:transmembrane [Cystoisospora suis]